MCDSSLTTLHSSITEIPPTQVTTNTTTRNAKSIENSINIPPIIDTSSFNKNTSRNITTKYLKPSWTTTTTTQTTSNTEMTVINLNNTTDTGLNVTDNQTLSTTLNILNSSIENATFGDDFNYNNTYVQNSERIGVEVDDVNGNNLSAAGITGITLGCVVIVGVICGISYFIYHNRGFNRPQVLNDRCSNPDSSGYIDDASVRVSCYYFSNFILLAFQFPYASSTFF